MLRHIRSLWPGAGWLLPLPFALWGASRVAIGEIRWEQLALMTLMPALAYANERTRRLFVAVFPLALLGLAYDAMRYVKDWGITPARLHVCDLRAIESSLFGRPDWTLHDWLQAHPVAWLDRFFAVPYGTYLFATVAFAIFLYVRAPGEAVTRFGWTFFVMSLLAFVTHHLYPAAPPWYFHAHGCNVDVSAHASEGPNLARVDHWLGVRYFAGFYGRSTDVFGCMPSLHVTNPLLILLEGWCWLRAPGRAAAVVFAIWMSMAAVYLDHHWIIDVVAGWAYCAAVYAAVSSFVRRAVGLGSPAGVITPGVQRA